MNKKPKPTLVRSRSHSAGKKRRHRSKLYIEHATPMAHVGFEGARHLHPDRMPSKQLERTVSLRLLDITPETIENVQNVSDSIKRLLVPGLSLKTIPDSLIDQLVYLEKLDLSQNQLSDSSIPDALKILDHLMELNLNNNKFTKVPSAIKKLKNISRLDLSHNGIDSLKGLEKCRKIQILIVDNNKLTSIFKDISAMRKLEILNCSNNSIKDIGIEIRQLKSLRELNMSDNKLTVLPTDVFLLPNLAVLNASYNKISKIPTFNVKVHNKHWVSEVDLSDNDLTKFPSHLLLMTKKLDLGSNKIQTLNMNTMKTLEGSNDQELCIDGNPLKFPPVDICESGIKLMMEYFHEVRLEMKFYRGIKVLVLGSHRSGKTSLVMSLQDQQARLTDAVHEKGAGIDCYDASFELEPGTDDLPGKSLQVGLWDFCGHPFYLYPHYVFFEQPSLAILTFNLTEYSDDRFDELIGCWFDWMIAKTNSICVLLVGTHSDKMSKTEIRKVSKDVKAKLTEYRNEHEKIINERVDKIVERQKISPTLQDQLSGFRRILMCMETFKVQGDVAVTSAANFKGYDLLKDAIITVANDHEKFPHVLTEVKTFWVDVENYLESKGSGMDVPVMHWDDYVPEVTGKFGMKRLIRDITSYLHETGKVVWFSKNENLAKYVFIRPAWLFELLKTFYRHDISQALDYNLDDSFKSVGLSLHRFERLKQEFLREGVLDKDLLKGLLSHLFPVDSTQEFEKVLHILLHAFEIGYPVTKKGKDNDYTFDVIPDEDGNFKINKILIPWLRKLPEPEAMNEKWESLSKKTNKVAAGYKFPKYMPPGLFEILCVRIHSKKLRDIKNALVKKHNVQFLAHWGGGLHTRHLKENIHIKIDYRKNEGDNGAILKFQFRDDSPEDAFEEVPTATMWNILLPMLMEFEEILKGYPGMENFISARIKIIILYFIL